MKKSFALIILLTSFVTTVVAQRKIIDIEAIKSWRRLGNYGISGDGKFIWYEVISQKEGAKLFVCDEKGKVLKEYPNARNVSLQGDNKLLFSLFSDKLYELEPLTGNENITEGVSAFKIPRNGNGQWVTYLQGGELWLKNCKTGKKTNYGKVRNTIFNNQGSVLLLQRDSMLTWIDLTSLKEFTVYSGRETGNVIFDERGNKLIFSVQSGDSSILYKYSKGFNSAKALNVGIGSINEVGFSPNGETVFLKRKRNVIPQIKDSMITNQVSIWHYKDMFLQSQQVMDDDLRRFVTLASFSTDESITLDSDSILLERRIGNKYTLIKNAYNEAESYWNKQDSTGYKLLILSTFQCRSFIPPSHIPKAVSLSTSEKYISWLDMNTNRYFCYDIQRNVLNDISSNFQIKGSIYGSNLITPFIAAGWLKDDRALLVYDNYDIWQIDPSNKRNPICITGGYGSKWNMIFKLAQNERYDMHDSILLSVLQDSTKYNGFAIVKLSAINKPEIRILTPCLYYFPSIFADQAPLMPLKAKKANVFLVQRRSEKEAPNLFSTKDFHIFSPISSIRPIDGYKWFNAEIIRWKDIDGMQQEGILYTPEGLDTTKKYPILFNYYMRKANERYKFHHPSLSNVNINIPWYLSRDYIVFIPDTYPSVGYTGMNAMKSVVGAAEYLTKKYPWINKEKMGLQGQSHGGFITNYIVSHSNLFAAAQSSAGPADLLSSYGGIGFREGSLQFIHEVGQLNLGATLWERPDIYIENSPVLSADKINTPLLLMHGINDNVVRFSQSIELFTALRRLRKRVWLLQYDETGHVLFEGENGYDFTVRQQQFFDHYLKGMPAPVWMTQGIPAYLKKYQSGLRVDTTFREP